MVFFDVFELNVEDELDAQALFLPTRAVVTSDLLSSTFGGVM